MRSNVTQRKLRDEATPARRVAAQPSEWNSRVEVLERPDNGTGGQHIAALARIEHTRELLRRTRRIERNEDASNLVDSQDGGDSRRGFRHQEADAISPAASGGLERSCDLIRSRLQLPVRDTFLAHDNRRRMRA